MYRSKSSFGEGARLPLDPCLRKAARRPRSIESYSYHSLSRISGSAVELARQAAARDDVRAAREVAELPVMRYHGVQKYGRRYAATLLNPFVKKVIWLSSYGTPAEAAYAYDAAARSVIRHWARLNFPELSPAAREVAAVDLTRMRRAPEPAHQQQPALRRQALLIRCWAPEPAGAAPPAFPFQREVTPQVYRVHYRPFSAAIGGELYATPFVLGVHDLNEPMPNAPASSALSSTKPGLAAAAPNRRELPNPSAMAMEPDQSVVGDNFTYVDGASLPAAPTFGWVW
ncbi:hypothetical protein SETIT_4G206900v2 [Setaria italica]|uniref:AP2/ERF domain-containing protein n=3 Tax=Setaria italica TaxID=4555 RepID=A0A368QWR2_SETIT|nr:hypothetical protein SETIT_4G206900v2 [Setaria italica]